MTAPMPVVDFNERFIVGIFHFNTLASATVEKLKTAAADFFFAQLPEERIIIDKINVGGIAEDETECCVTDISVFHANDYIMPTYAFVYDIADVSEAFLTISEHASQYNGEMSFDAAFKIGEHTFHCIYYRVNMALLSHDISEFRKDMMTSV